jgi:dCMP deaminase
MAIGSARPHRDETGLLVALALAQRATCVRRQAGCLLVDSTFRFIGAGYNGPQANAPHCIDKPCAGAALPSGTGLDACEAIHAEQNALMYCADVTRIHTAYTTCAPCVHCTKLLLGTSCQRIVFADPYPHEASQELWQRAGRWWSQLDYDLRVNPWLKRLVR